MRDENETMSTLPLPDLGTFGKITAARVETGIAIAHRLVRKKSTGELSLQGLFTWKQGWERGQEWRDIPTVEVDDV